MSMFPKILLSLIESVFESSLAWCDEVFISRPASSGCRVDAFSMTICALFALDLLTVLAVERSPCRSVCSAWSISKEIDFVPARTVVT